MISNKENEFSTTLDFNGFRTHGEEAIAAQDRTRLRRREKRAAVRGGGSIILTRRRPAPVTRGRNRREGLDVMIGGNTRPGGGRHHRHRGLWHHHCLTTSRHGAALESQCVKKIAHNVVCVLAGKLGCEG